MRVLGSVSRGGSCRKEEKEDVRTPGWESQLGPEEKPRARLALPYLWHADAIPGRNVRLTLYGATGVVAARRACGEGVFTCGCFHHDNQDISGGLEVEQSLCGDFWYYCYPTPGQRCCVTKNICEDRKPG